jgi:capsular exopolysaccharide synthesis family protein
LPEGEWEAALNEAVDSTRTLFLHSATVHHLRKVMVTSAVGGEGKTSLSARLASSLARTGRRVLLIDADLRSPALQQHFEVADGPGVCEILRGESTLQDCIRSNDHDHLSLLLAGHCDRHALHALAQDGFKRLLAEVDTLHFDFILIDSSPVLPVADALVIAPNVDGVLFSLMVDVSQVDRVNAACQKLASIDVPLLGAVVNGTRSETYGYGPKPLATV